MAKIVLNVDIGRVLSFSQNVWSAAYDVIWSMSMKLSSPQAFWLVVMMMVTVVMVPFFMAIVIAMPHGSLDDSDDSLGSLICTGV